MEARIERLIKSGRRVQLNFGCESVAFERVKLRSDRAVYEAHKDWKPRDAPATWMPTYISIACTNTDDFSAERALLACQ